jgi:hypothetical protein
MAEIYVKKDKNTLTVTCTTNETHITEEDRAEIQTKIDHLEFDKVELEKKIDALKNKIAILDK